MVVNLMRKIRAKICDIAREEMGIMLAIDTEGHLYDCDLMYQDEEDLLYELDMLLPLDEYFNDEILDIIYVNLGITSK